MNATTAIPESIETARPVRVILRDFIQNIAEGEDEIDHADLIEYALRRFSNDREFLQAAARDLIPILVPEVLADVVHKMRRTAVETPRGAVSTRKLELTARERLASVFEGTGKGKYRSFLTLQKRQLLSLNDRDQREIDSRMRWVNFRSDLAGRMDDLRPVGEAFTGAQLDQAWKRHFEPQSGQ